MQTLLGQKQNWMLFNSLTQKSETKLKYAKNKISAQEILRSSAYPPGTRRYESTICTVPHTHIHRHMNIG